MVGRIGTGDGEECWWYKFGVSGCTNCRGKSGCNDRKGAMFDAVYGTLERAYPTRRWGDTDPLVAIEHGISEHEGEVLAEELAAELRASTFYRPGGDDELCNYIYVLCVGREPCAIQIRDGNVAIPDEARGESLREVYLRVALSSIGRLVGVQQVAVELDWDGDGYELREVTRDGVYDAPLLRRFQKLVSILPEHDLVNVDFGEICEPVEGYGVGSYAAHYPGTPVLANFLFFPQPPAMTATAYVPLVE